MSSLKLLHSGGNGVIIAAPSSNPAANRTITLNDNYAGDGSFVTANSSGNVGIGTSSPTNNLHLGASGADQVRSIKIDGTNGSSELQGVILENDGENSRFNLKIGSGGSTPSNRFTINSSGTTQMTGDAGSGDAQHFKFFASGDVVHLKTAGTSAANHGMIQFRDGNNSYCGQITSHGTNHTTSYVTNSDYRLKQNEASISDGITRLKQLKPYRFEWKSSGNIVDGFFAHEAQAVVPESVIGTKDEVDSDNDPVYQGIDQSKLVPLLTAALQEAIIKVETLETEKTQMQTDITALTARVAALEAG